MHNTKDVNMKVVHANTELIASCFPSRQEHW